MNATLRATSHRVRVVIMLANMHPRSNPRDAVKESADLAWRSVAAPRNMPVRPDENKFSFVSVSDRGIVDLDDLERHASRGRGAFKDRAVLRAAKAQQGEPAAE